MELCVLSVKTTKEDHNFTDITVRKIPGKIARLFGYTPEEVTYRGVGGTVWHELPSYSRPGTLMEGFLSNQYKKARLEKTIDYA